MTSCGFPCSATCFPTVYRLRTRKRSSRKCFSFSSNISVGVSRQRISRAGSSGPLITISSGIGKSNVAMPSASTRRAPSSSKRRVLRRGRMSSGKSHRGSRRFVRWSEPCRNWTSVAFPCERKVCGTATSRRSSVFRSGQLPILFSGRSPGSPARKTDGRSYAA